MKSYTKISDIRKVLPTLKSNTVPGFTNDGARIVVRYERFGPVKEERKLDTIPAKRAGLDLRVYTGVLDKVWTTRNKDLVFSMLVLERLDAANGKYSYRTINTSRGRVRYLKVI